MTSTEVISLGTAIVVLVAIAAIVGQLAGLGQASAVLTATVRAALQILAVGAVLGVIFRHQGLAPLYLVVMLLAAAWTSGRRLAPARGATGIAALAIASGAGMSALTIFACHALDLNARNVVPLMAQLIGGSMTATTLSGQRLLDDVHSAWADVEAWLAIGATPWQAVREPARRSAARALIPALDQTRNVGLVVLPGAFVGLLLAGATPLQAGRVQLLVLVGLITAETIAAVITTSLLSRGAGIARPIRPAG